MKNSTKEFPDSFKDKLHLHVGRQLRKRKGTDSWLKEAIPFKHPKGKLYKFSSDYQSQQVEELFKRLPLSNRSETRLAFRQFVACLLKRHWKATRISRNANDWKKGRYNKVGAVIIKIMDTMYEENYIGMKKGYQYSNDSAQTRVWATDKLLEACPVIPNNIREEPTEVVILKGEKENDKRPVIDYKDTRFTYRVRRKIRRINSLYRETSVRYLHYNIHPFLRASFVERWTWGGRLYTSGYRHVQGLSQDERAELTINDESVVEADFSALHPRLLYAWKGIQYDGDPYTAISEDEDIRTFLKIILLCMINEDEFVGAVRAANDWLYKFPRKDQQTGIERRPRVGFDHQRLIDRLTGKDITSAAPLVEAFMAEHRPIAEYLCSDHPTGHLLRHAWHDCPEYLNAFCPTECACHSCPRQLYCRLPSLPRNNQSDGQTVWKGDRWDVLSGGP